MNTPFLIYRRINKTDFIKVVFTGRFLCKKERAGKAEKRVIKISEDKLIL
jgi:hypothetical protein